MATPDQPEESESLQKKRRNGSIFIWILGIVSYAVPILAGWMPIKTTHIVGLIVALILFTFIIMKAPADETF